MIEKFYKHRFETFLITQLAVLFGSLFFPDDFFEYTLLPMLFLTNIMAGVLVISKNKKLTWFLSTLFLVALIIFGNDMINRVENEYMLIRLTIYFVFHIIVTLNIILQVWKAKKVTKNVIVGLMSGYISLGLLGFFLFMTIEIANPNAFTGVLFESSDNIKLRSDGLLYYAFITLLTIGYGEIVPAIPIAQKAAILVGLMGQFYMVIITAVVVEKYIRHNVKNELE